MQELNIRQYKEEDFQEVWDLNKLALDDVGANMNDDSWNDDLKKISEIYLDKGDFLVGIIDDKLIAMGAFKKINNSIAEILRMRVHPDFQDQRVGLKILKKLEEKAKTKKFQKLILETTTIQKAAQKLYKKNGYLEIGTKKKGEFNCLIYQKILKFQIIPAIDILDCKCVRLLKGDYDQSKIYNHDPVSIAKRFKEAGFDYLHIVDLDVARAGELINLEVVQEIYTQTDIKLEVGGGVREVHDFEKLIDIGAARIIIGSMVVKDWSKFKKITERFRERIIVGLDVKNEFIATDGWTETSKISLEEILEKLIKLKINDFFITDIDCDGTLAGPNFSLYEKIRKRFPNINLAASGGVSSIEDVKNLKEINIDGVILGKVIYEERVGLRELWELCR